MFKIDHDPYRLTVDVYGETVCVSLCVSKQSGHAIILSRDEARMLCTDLGEMLGKFEVAEAT